MFQHPVNLIEGGGGKGGEGRLQGRTYIFWSLSQSTGTEESKPSTG